MGWPSNVLWAVASRAPDSGCAVRKADLIVLWDLCAAHPRLEGITARQWMHMAARHSMGWQIQGELRGVVKESSRRSLRQVLLSF